MRKKRIFRQKVKRLAQIDRDFLRTNFIQGVLLDLDNTIVSEDDVYLSPEAESWIHSAQKEGIKFFILSNGKRIYRVNYWSSRLKIPAISPAKKPFISSFRKALKALQLESSQVIVVGDSFHTGRLLSKNITQATHHVTGCSLHFRLAYFLGLLHYFINGGKKQLFQLLAISIL